VDTGDFVLSPTGVTGASITGVTPVSGSTYTVTVNTGTGNGTLRLDVLDDDSIVDGSNNPLGGAGTGNGNFTSGETYTISKSVGVDVYMGTGKKGNYTIPTSGSRESDQ
jgi:hypothetical protein